MIFSFLLNVWNRAINDHFGQLVSLQSYESVSNLFRWVSKVYRNSFKKKSENRSKDRTKLYKVISTLLTATIISLSIWFFFYGGSEIDFWWIFFGIGIIFFTAIKMPFFYWYCVGFIPLGEETVKKYVCCK